MKTKFRWLQYVLHAAVLGGLITAGVKYINGDAFARAMKQFNWWYAPLICALSLAYVVIKGFRFAQMIRAVAPDVPLMTVLRAYVAGQAATLLPGGVAARAGILKQVGIPAATTAAPIAVSSMSDQAMFLICSVVAALWIEDVRRPVLYLLTGLAVVSALLGIEASRTWLARVVERLMGRFNLLDQWKRFTTSLRDIATPQILLGGMVNTAVAFACMLCALYLAVRGVGGTTVSPATLLLAFALPTMLGRISALPGGVGVTEAGMVGILDHAPGITLDQAAAAVTVFRVGTVLFSAFVGGLVYLFGWRGAKEKEIAEEQNAVGENGADEVVAGTKAAEAA